MPSSVIVNGAVLSLYLARIGFSLALGAVTIIGFTSLGVWARRKERQVHWVKLLSNSFRCSASSGELAGNTLKSSAASPSSAAWQSCYEERWISELTFCLRVTRLVTLSGCAPSHHLARRMREHQAKHQRRRKVKQAEAGGRVILSVCPVHLPNAPVPHTWQLHLLFTLVSSISSFPLSITSGPYFCSLMPVSDILGPYTCRLHLSSTPDPYFCL